MSIGLKRIDAAISPTPENDSATGDFAVVLSTPAKDRQGDELKSDGWVTPLPKRIQFNTDHSFDVGDTVGSGVPSIDADGNLVVRGTFASTKHGQNTRLLVNEGHIDTVSVAYRSLPDGKRELINGSFVVVPANPEAKVLASKSISVDIDPVDFFESVTGMKFLPWQREVLSAILGKEHADKKTDDVAPNGVPSQESSPSPDGDKAVPDGTVESKSAALVKGKARLLSLACNNIDTI